MNNEHRFAGWNPFDDSHIKNIKDVQDENIDIEQVFEPDDCTMVMEDYGKCQDYPCDDCVTRFLKNYKGDN
jgi:hypothetical protein